MNSVVKRKSLKSGLLGSFCRFGSLLWLALLFGGSGVSAQSGQGGFYPKIGGDFELEGVAGSVALSKLPGEWKLLGFGYSHCPDICSMLLAKMNKVYQAVASEPDQLGVVFVSIDSARDSDAGLSKLQAFVGRFNEQFIGLSGDSDAVSQVSKRYAAYFGEQPETREFSHTDRIYLVNREGRIKKIYSRSVSTGEVAADVKKLIK